MSRVDHVGPFDVEEVPGVVDDLHFGALGQERERVVPMEREQHAVVVAPVQVQGGLGRGQQGRRLLVGQLGHLQLGLVEGAVVADGGDMCSGSPMDSLTRATSQLPS